MLGVTKSSQTNNATSALDLEINDERSIVGVIDVCPDASGALNASVDVHAQMTELHGGTTRTRTATSSSTFAGIVDDAASLKRVTQTMHDQTQWDSGSYDANLSTMSIWSGYNLRHPGFCPATRPSQFLPTRY